MVRSRPHGAVAVIAAVLVAACSGGPAPSASSPATDAPEPSTATTAPSTDPGPSSAWAPPTELTIWINGADAQPLKDLYAQFEAETGHTLEIVAIPADGFETAVQQKLATGDRPDILEWFGAFNFVAAIDPVSNLRDLSSEAFVERQRDLNANNASIDGKVYGVMLNTPTWFGIFYNKETFARLGLTPPTNAAELLETCRAIKAADPSIAPVYEAVGSSWPPLVQVLTYMANDVKDGYAEAIKSRAKKVNEPDSPWKRAAEYYLELQAAGCYNEDHLTAKFEQSAQKIMDGEAAMVFQHTGIIQMAIDAYGKDTVDEQLGFQAWSERSPVVAGQIGPHGTYYLPKTGDSAREAAALDFVRFVSGPVYEDYVKAAGQIPVLADTPIPTDLPLPMQEIGAQLDEYGSTIPIWDLLPGLTDLLAGIDRVAAGQLDPQGLVDLMQAEAEQGAAAAGLPAWP